LWQIPPETSCISDFWDSAWNIEVEKKCEYERRKGKKDKRIKVASSAFYLIGSNIERRNKMWEVLKENLQDT
jgi:hypothetical protein